ncbi:hypothetical protein, partial [Mycobacterium intermedium]|uniref:hypothetical protein n=1 Tax=Mycobacterium intermedium TaxID=28445 RepID=UPI0021F2AC6F
RGAFPLERLNPREVQLFLAGQALSHIYTPKLTTFHEKSGLTTFMHLAAEGAAAARVVPAAATTATTIDPAIRTQVCASPPRIVPATA